MASPTGIAALSNELLREILESHIEADPEKLVSLERRSYLSQESFKLPPSPVPDQAQTIGNFRLVCKRFSELGAVHQFARVTTRFSRKGLKRLENIASQQHLSKHVKKFSYMVPYFYVEGRERVRELLPSLEHSVGSLDAGNFERKAKEQRVIVRSEEDVRVLKLAMRAFTSLQHVQILRVQDYEDGLLLGYIRQHSDSTQLVDLKWAPACSHSTMTIGTALLASRSPVSRFSSPMLSPQSAIGLASHTPRVVPTLASRITCLELHFDDGTDLDNKMMELSPLFKTVFMAARNMQAVHIGFPSHRPVNIKLEDLFHGVRWEKLSAFGIQAWRLNADEIIALAGRHRERLKGLRLRDVLLREGSMWKDVLGFLRDGMSHLDWVSLRRIGYAVHFDQQWAAAGAEVPDDPPGGASESDYESGEDFQSDGDDTQHDLNEENGDNESSTERSDADDDHGPSAHEIEFPQLPTEVPASEPWCNCNGRQGPSSIEELGDNGMYVTNAQRKLWEKWVVRRCPVHSQI